MSCIMHNTSLLLLACFGAQLFSIPDRPAAL